MNTYKTTTRERFTRERFTRRPNSRNAYISDCLRRNVNNKDILEKSSVAVIEQICASGVRAVIRDHSANMIPLVVGLIHLDNPDEWGNDWIIEVQYDTRGWLASYGGHFDVDKDGLGTALYWQCYMD